MSCPLVTSQFEEQPKTPTKKLGFPASSESVFEAVKTMCKIPADRWALY